MVGATWYSAFWRWLDTPIIFWRSMIGSLGIWRVIQNSSAREPTVPSALGVSSTLGKSSKHIFSQMVVNNRDEYPWYKSIRKKSPSKQIHVPLISIHRKCVILAWDPLKVANQHVSWHHVVTRHPHFSAWGYPTHIHKTVLWGMKRSAMTNTTQLKRVVGLHPFIWEMVG